MIIKYDPAHRELEARIIGSSHRNSLEGDLETSIQAKSNSHPTGSEPKPSNPILLAINDWKSKWRPGNALFYSAVGCVTGAIGSAVLGGGLCYAGAAGYCIYQSGKTAMGLTAIAGVGAGAAVMSFFNTSDNFEREVLVAGLALGLSGFIVLTSYLYGGSMPGSILQVGAYSGICGAAIGGLLGATFGGTKEI